MTVEEEHKAVAQKIIDRLSELGISRKDFSQMMDVTPSCVTRWLSGKHNFTVKTLMAIEVVLGFCILKYY